MFILLTLLLQSIKVGRERKKEKNGVEMKYLSGWNGFPYLTAVLLEVGDVISPYSSLVITTNYVGPSWRRHMQEVSASATNKQPGTFSSRPQTSSQPNKSGMSNSSPRGLMFSNCTWQKVLQVLQRPANDCIMWHRTWRAGDTWDVVSEDPCQNIDSCTLKTIQPIRKQMDKDTRWQREGRYCFI